MNYEPKPINTDRVVLPPEVENLVEKLARNTHEIWSKTRLDQGWTWGPERDDAGKRHPCITPYENLSEAERDVDRNTAAGVLKTILALGYKIEPARETDNPQGES
ncbi:MAG: Ryanodine receptor Ryr [Nitrospinaceae bacterium]|nr:Ryanodine receptor Ryr [Nitrospinaceae bacterium]